MAGPTSEDFEKHRKFCAQLLEQFDSLPPLVREVFKILPCVDQILPRIMVASEQEIMQWVINSLIPNLKSDGIIPPDFDLNEELKRLRRPANTVLTRTRSTSKLRKA